MTAHHADDRAETFLLNALRGSGLDGVSSIPRSRPLGAGRILRPLLDFSRASLIHYLEKHDLKWIEDPSNQDSGPDRNFVRNEVMPLLESRWPAARRTLARTAEHLGSANILLKKLIDHTNGLSGLKHQLPLGLLTALGEESASLVLRQWLHGYQVPESRLIEFLNQVSEAGSESKCELRLESGCVRIFRDELYLSEPGDFESCPEKTWSGESTLELGTQLGEIQVTGTLPSSRPDWLIGPRNPGTSIQAHADGPNRKLKKILQEQFIPPWQRQSIPILYQRNEVLAIGDWQFSPEFSQWLTANDLKYQLVSSPR